MPQRRRSGFTLIELMMVIVIMSLLLGMVSSAFFKSRENAKRNRAKTDVETLAAALWNFRTEYGIWPTEQMSGTKIYGSDNHKAFEYLKQENEATNPRGVQFMNFSEYRHDGHGNLIDPWGIPYVVELSLDEDRGTVSTGPGSKVSAKKYF